MIEKTIDNKNIEKMVNGAILLMEADGSTQQSG